MKLPALLFGLALLSTSCITRQDPPNEAELAAADYGLQPVAHEDRVKKFVRAEYQRLHVIEVEVGTPQRAWWGSVGGLVVPRDIHYGWRVKFRGYGIGFTGMKPVILGDAFFKDDVLEGCADGADGFRWVDPRARW